MDNGFGDLEPVIVGRKITVHDIAGLVVLGQSSVEWVAENYDLTLAQIHAALAYYYDHQAQIDREMQEAAALAAQVGRPLDETIARLKAKP